MKIKILTAITLLTMASISCKKENQTSSVFYQVRTTNRSTTIGITDSNENLSNGSLTNARRYGVQGGTIDWIAGSANVTEIQFEAEGINGKVEYKSETPQKIDLFAPLVGLGNIIIPPGSYQEVVFEIELVGTSTLPALELNGTYNTSKVIFRLFSDHEIEGEQTNVTISSTSDYTSTISLNLSLLTQGISAASLDNATKDASGTIVISANSNMPIYNAMLTNLDNIEEEDFQ